MNKPTYPHSLNSHVQRRLAPYLASAAVMAASVSGQSDLYWNPDTGGAGNWNSTDTAWSTDPAGPGDTAWSGSAGSTDIAIFDFSGAAISLQEALGAGGLRFNVDGYTLNAPTLTELQLNADRTLHVAAGAEATLGNLLRLMAPGTGTLGFEKTGAGTLIVNGPYGSNANQAYFGDGFGSANRRSITVSAGTLQVESASLSNTRNDIAVASGATLVANNNLNIGGISGDGHITGSNGFTIRGHSLNFAGVISGDLGFRHLNQAGAQTFSGSQDNTFTGDMWMNNGTQIFAKDAGVIAMSGAVIRMDAGNSQAQVRWDNSEQVSVSTVLRFESLGTGQNLVNLNGHSERMGDLVLNLSTPSTGKHVIDFGTNAVAQYLWFGDFIVNDSNAPFIHILNFEENVDSLRFDSNPTAGLSYLRFDDGEELLTAKTFFDSTNDYWVVAPIPEPAAAAWLLALGAFGYLIWHRRRA